MFVFVIFFMNLTYQVKSAEVTDYISVVSSARLMAEDLMHLAIIESAKDHDSAAVFGLRLPNKLLYKWYEEGKCDGCKLIKELNRSIVGNCVAIREDSA